MRATSRSFRRVSNLLVAAFPRSLRSGIFIRSFFSDVARIVLIPRAKWQERIELTKAWRVEASREVRQKLQGK